MRTVAIDQGTTSTRALSLDHDGSEIDRALPHRQSYPHAGWVEHDPEELLRNVRACLDVAGDADAIGIDNQGESCLAWNGRTGVPVSPVIVWQDSRTQATVDRLKAAGAEALTLEVAGLPLDPYFSATKLAWILVHIPEAKRLRKTGDLRLGTTDAYFLDRLTGVFATDVTTASRTSLMNLRTCAWDAALCDTFGVPIDALPEIRPTTGDFGAVRIGTREVPVTASVVDQQAALYGHGCRSPGDTKITFGTGAFVLAVTGAQPMSAPERGLLPTVAWKRGDDPTVYALDGGVYNAGSAVDWARGLGLFSDYGEIGAFAKPPAIGRGLVFVPALSGLACPHWDRRAAGLWAGLTLDSQPADLMQALLEGIALRVAEVVEAMAAQIAVGEIISIDGGLSHNVYFCQFLADVLRRTVAVQTLAELTAFGCALLAGGPKIETGSPPAERRFFRPRNSDADKYRERFAKAVELVKELPR